jgi:hypothetical protein
MGPRHRAPLAAKSPLPSQLAPPTMAKRHGLIYPHASHVDPDQKALLIHARRNRLMPIVTPSSAKPWRLFEDRYGLVVGEIADETPIDVGPLAIRPKLKRRPRPSASSLRSSCPTSDGGIPRSLLPGPRRARQGASVQERRRPAGRPQRPSVGVCAFARPTWYADPMAIVVPPRRGLPDSGTAAMDAPKPLPLRIFGWRGGTASAIEALTSLRKPGIIHTRRRGGRRTAALASRTMAAPIRRAPSLPLGSASLTAAARWMRCHGRLICVRSNLC